MHTETLNLTTANGPTTAYIARPEGGFGAAVLLIQEWWGINDHIRDIAGRYAREGYLCVAPDLFRGQLAKDSAEASSLMHALTLKDGMDTILQATKAARDTYKVTTFGITGYCMGGTFALRAACEMPELAAAAPFYGDTPETKVLQELRVPTLFIAGSRDNWINSEKVGALKAATAKYNLPLEVVVYDADHAFFNDTRPEVYNKNAATDAWQRVLKHFGRHLLRSMTA